MTKNKRIEIRIDELRKSILEDIALQNNTTVTEIINRAIDKEIRLMIDKLELNNLKG